MIEGVIYKYTSPSNKIYIGQTTNEARRRAEWFYLKMYYSHKGTKIDNARLKYGPSNFKYEVLERIIYNNIEEATRELDRLEIYYIKLYNSYKNGYNLTIGGSSTRGLILSEEARNKISRIHKGKKLTKKQIDSLVNSNTGRKHSLETRLKISKANKGKCVSPESRMKISRALTGRKLSKQAKINISNGHKGIKQSGDWKTKRLEVHKKKVDILDLHNNIVAQFNSIKDAAKFLNISKSSATYYHKGKKIINNKYLLRLI